MKRYLPALLAVVPAPALAQVSVGDVLTNTAESMYGFPDFVSHMCYGSGLVLATSAVFKLKEHVNNVDKGGAQIPLRDPIMRSLAAGGFFTAPFMAEVVTNSMFYGADPISATGWNMNAQASGSGLDAMLVRIMSDVSGPAELLLTVFAYIAALGFLSVGMGRLARAQETGPRGPSGFGTTMTFLVSGALFSYGPMMGVFATSLFGDAELATRPTIADDLGIDRSSAASIETVIQSVLAFVMIVGMIAFVRGWFVLRNWAEGQGGATMAQGLTFLFGGALAINLGELINAVQETIDVTGVTFI